MKYLEYLKNKEYDKLATINFINELVEIEYEGKYLIEYLLEAGVHSKEMDNYLIYHQEFANYYLKYNVIKPFLNVSLKVLLSKYNNDLILDLVLDKLNYEDKIKLYYNIRKNSYTDFFYQEQLIKEIYLKHGIVLPNVFISTKLNDNQDNLNLSMEDKVLIEKFKETFQDNDIKLISFIAREFERSLISDHDRSVLDIKKLIDFKNNNQEFKFIDTRNKDGSSYDKDSLEFKTSSNDALMFHHEFSHFLYDSFESSNSYIEYSNIRKKIVNIDNYIKVKDKLTLIHQKYQELEDKYLNIYLEKIISTYGSIEKYVEYVYLEMKDNFPDILEFYDSVKGRTIVSFVNDINIKDVVRDFIELEKQEYVTINKRKDFRAYLMLENLLDAIFEGWLFDDLEFECLSGHGSLYFNDKKSRSFDECLANYDAIKDNLEVVNILKELIGEELIEYLDRYIKENREVEYGR